MPWIGMCPPKAASMSFITKVCVVCVFSNLHITAAQSGLVNLEGFNDWGGRGYNDFVPGEVTKTAPSGDETT